jgi:hypothetical protein
MAASGGTVTLTASCSNAAGATYTWKRNEVEITGNGSSTTNSIGANTATTAVTYTYAVQACVAGVGCSSEITKAYIQDGTGGGTGTNYCGSYTNVASVNLPWGGVVDADPGSGIGASGALAAKFTVPLGAKGSGKIIVTEISSSQATRTITVSPNACDFGQGKPLLSVIATYFQEYYSTGPNPWGDPVLEPGKTYYVNVRNQHANGASSCPAGQCKVRITLNASS